MTHRLVYYDGKRPQAHVENLVVKTDTGNVGIGTSTPGSKLHIQDTSYPATLNIRSSATPGNGVGGKIIFGQSNDGIAQIEGKYNGTTDGFNKDLIFYSGGNLGAPKMILKGDGKLGVGNTTPSSLLHIEGASAKQIIQATSGNPEIEFNDGGTDEFSIYYDTGKKSLNFVEGGIGTHLAINDGGNVGIGTTDPSVKLHVKGAVSDGRLILESVEQARLDLYSNDYGSGLGANVNLIFQQLNDFGNCFSVRRFGSPQGKINVSMDDNGTNVLNLKANNVGIRTLNPVNPLDVTVTVPFGISGPEANSFPIASFRALQTDGLPERGLEIGAPPGGPIPNGPVYLKVRGTNARFSILNDSNVENFTILDTGKVGIGTTNPSEKLDVNGNIKTNSNINTTDRLAVRQTNYGYSGTYKVVQYGNCASESSISLGYDPIDNGNSQFKGNEILIPYNKAIIAPTSDDNGYVGILRLASSNILQIGGSTYSTHGHIRIDEASGNVGIDTSTFCVDAVNDRVGIGTTSPSYKLEVNGTTTTSNIVVDSTDGGGSFSMNTLTLDLADMSYKTYAISVNADLNTLIVDNHILGSQAIVFIEASAAITINDVASANILTGYSSVALSSGERAIMTICSDGTRRYVNCVKYT